MIETPHVLIVEDEEILLRFLEYHVQQAGYRASPVSTGAAMFQVLETDPPDLILLDLGLPDGDGLTRAQQIRERSDVPIVVLTARQGADDRLMALGLGADDYLTKPCDPRELLLRIRNVLARGRSTPTQRAAPAPGPVVAPAPPAPTTPAAERRGNAMTLLLAALLIAVIGGGGGVFWYLARQPPAPLTAEPASESEPAPARQQALSPPPASTPAPVPQLVPRPELDVSVTASPDAGDGDERELAGEREETPGTAGPDIGQTAASRSYAWVLKSKCPPLPQVEWWRVKKHFDLVRYVNRRHGGDWQPYIQSWVERLAKLQDVYARNSGIKTKTGKVLRGETLKAYIDQTQRRLDVTMCLSREAAEFAYRKSLIQR